MSHSPNDAQTTMQHEIDEIDKRILNILQEDATLPLKNIAEQVHASVATCQRRIQFMMDTGVIAKQVAIINPAALGYHLTALIHVKLAQRHPAAHAEFEAFITLEPQVVSCFAMSGRWDFTLIVHSPSMREHYQFMQDILTSEHNIAETQADFVMNFTSIGSKVTLS